MNRKKKNRITLVAALLIGVVMLAVPAFACPPGTRVIQTGTDTIGEAGTWCVPAGGVTLGVALTVAASNVTIVGETPSARLTGSPTGAVITVNAGMMNVVIHNLTIVPGAADQVGINFKGGDGTIQAVTFDGDTTNAFTGAAVQLYGINTVVRNNTFRMTAEGNLAAIQLRAGSMGARISDNEVKGTAARPTFFIENASTSSYNDLQAWNNTIDFANVLIGGANGFTNSVIRDNTATTLQAHGIDLASNSTNTQVLRNVFTYGYSGTANVVGIRDRGGSNNEYRDNRITAHTNAGTDDDAIEVASSNVVISGNRIDATGAGHAIDANPASGATNATITDNTIIGAGGDGITMTDAANFIITGNTFTNITGIGINTDGGALHTISNNTFIDVVGIGINSAGNNTISGNTLTNITAVGIQSGANDQVTGNTITSVNDHGINVDGNNATISGNTIRNILANGVGINVDDQNHNVGDQNHNEITNNIIESVAQDGILVTSGDNNTITGNTITGAAKNATAAAPFAAIRIMYPGTRHTVIDNNTIINPGSLVYAVGIDIGGDYSDNSQIINNTVEGFTTVTGTPATVSTGIILRVRITDTLLAGNIIRNPGNMRVGIEVLATNAVRVENNTIEGMNHVGLLLRGGTVPNPHLVQGNTLTGNVTGIYMVDGVSEITDGNRVTGGATALLVASFANAVTFDLHGNSFDASIFARNDGLGMLDATGNYWARPPVRGVNIIENIIGGGYVDFGNPLAVCPVQLVPVVTVCCDYPAGWNLISVPVVPEDPSAVAVFGQYAAVLWGHDPVTGYFHPTTVAATEGFWLFLPTAQQFCVRGTVPATDQTIVLENAGWHIIGTLFYAYWENTQVTHGGDTRALLDAGDWILPVAFGWDPIAAQYYVLQAPQAPMLPCLGYWVHTRVNNVTLTIPLTQQLPPAPPVHQAAITAVPGMTPPPPPPIPGAGGRVTRGLVFTNAPNPVTDVNTTTFMVKGALSDLVERIRVQIFDLSGRLVFEAEEAGARLDWHTDNMYGEFLANGIYLFKLYARIGDEWVVSEVRKLAIFR